MITVQNIKSAHQVQWDMLRFDRDGSNEIPTSTIVALGKMPGSDGDHRQHVLHWPIIHEGRKQGVYVCALKSRR